MINFNSDPENVFKEIDISEEEQKVLFESIARKMAPTPLKLRADFELTCFTYEGIDALKAALLTSKKIVNDKDKDIQVAVSILHQLFGSIVQADRPTSLPL